MVAHGISGDHQDDRIDRFLIQSPSDVETTPKNSIASISMAKPSPVFS